MTNDLQVFNYGEKAFRTYNIDGEFWFVAKDVCDILGLTNARKAVSSLDDDEKMTVTNSYSHSKKLFNDNEKMTLQNERSHSGQRGGAQFLNIINESGLYTLIMRSNKPEAKKFRKWVTGTVLPSIRRNGSFSLDQQNESFNYLSRGIMNSAKKIFEHALNCKTENDFLTTVALDNIFKDFTGKSALKTAGLKLVKKSKSVPHLIEDGDFKGCYWYEHTESFEWENDLLKNVPHSPALGE